MLAKCLVLEWRYAIRSLRTLHSHSAFRSSLEVQGSAPSPACAFCFKSCWVKFVNSLESRNQDRSLMPEEAASSHPASTEHLVSKAYLWCSELESGPASCFSSSFLHFHIAWLWTFFLLTLMLIYKLNIWDLFSAKSVIRKLATLKCSGWYSCLWSRRDGPWSRKLRAYRAFTLNNHIFSKCICNIMENFLESDFLYICYELFGSDVVISLN